MTLNSAALAFPVKKTKAMHDGVQASLDSVKVRVHDSTEPNGLDLTCICDGADKRQVPKGHQNMISITAGHIFRKKKCVPIHLD